MIERLNSIKQEILDGIENHANSRATAFELRKQFLDSKTGKIGQLMKEMKNIAPEERANFGKSVNELKDWASSVFADLDGQTLLNSLKSRKVNRQLKIQERAIRNKNEKRGKDKESKG